MHSTLEKPANAQHPGPLNIAQRHRLTQAIQGLSASQLSWASGYLAGISDHLSPTAENQPRATVTLVYASQTGNGKTVAERLADTLTSQGLAPQLLPVSDFRPRDLGKVKTLILVVSTHGEGEPPEGALEFYRYLHGPRAPQLESLSFAVFGLGDSSYQHFCKAARDFDERLEALGGKRLHKRVDSDIDFLQPSRQWVAEISEKIARQRPSAQLIPLPDAANKRQVNRDHPYTSMLLERRPVTTLDALSEVHHLVLRGEQGVLTYSPGDALGVWFENDQSLVEEILSRTKADGEQLVDLDRRQLPLREALTRHLELTQLHPSVVRRWVELKKNTTLAALSRDGESLRTYCRGRQFIDILDEHPATPNAATLSALLQPLQPRLYSIASSQAEFQDEIHLTVSLLDYHVQGRPRLGGASGFLGRRLHEGAALQVYVAENSDFRLPASGDTPIIMVGAGTGVAPYRAFLQQRAAEGGQGRNWLFCGNRHFHRDFLYQQDWLDYRKAGLLDRVTPAFSRDQRGGAYVQDRLLESGKEVYTWLEQGAIVYVCGSAPMEAGVRNTLQQIVATQAGLSTRRAGEYFDQLRQTGRYKRDIY